MPARPQQLGCSGQADTELLGQLHALFAQLWQRCPGVGDLDQMLFCTAVTEVVNNIVLHAQSSTVSVELTADDAELVARLVDDGRAAEIDLDAVTLPDDLVESGRGLPIVVMAVDEVSYRRAEGRNHWLLQRRRRPDED